VTCHRVVRGEELVDEIDEGCYVNGIDVSAYQSRPDWATVKRSGLVQFAYAKATEGAGFIDEQYARNARICREQAIAFGAYHVFRFDVDAAAQASNFLRTAAIKPGDLAPAADVESGQGSAGALATFLELVEREIKTAPIIYTNAAFWEGTMGGTDAFAGRYSLWIAQYDDAPAPTLPAGWKAWRLWQYASTGNVPGIAGDVDLDRSNGDLVRVP